MTKQSQCIVNPIKSNSLHPAAWGVRLFTFRTRWQYTTLATSLRSDTHDEDYSD